MSHEDLSAITSSSPPITPPCTPPLYSTTNQINSLPLRTSSSGILAARSMPKSNSPPSPLASVSVARNPVVSSCNQGDQACSVFETLLSEPLIDLKSEGILAAGLDFDAELPNLGLNNQCGVDSANWDTTYPAIHTHRQTLTSVPGEITVISSASANAPFHGYHQGASSSSSAMQQQHHGQQHPARVFYPVASIAAANSPLEYPQHHQQPQIHIKKSPNYGYTGYNWIPQVVQPVPTLPIHHYRQYVHHQQPPATTTTPQGRLAVKREPGFGELSALESTSPKRTSNGASPRVVSCLVCGGGASKLHYGAAVCSRCGNLFRQGVLTGASQVCSCHCPTQPTDLAYCQSCHMKKCRLVGMRMEAVLTEKFPLTWQSLGVTALEPPPDSGTELCSSRVYAAAKSPKDAMFPDSRALATLLEQISAAELLILNTAVSSVPADVSVFGTDVKSTQFRESDTHETAVNLILWSRKVPGFSHFPEADQFQLLKSACLELLLAHFALHLARGLSSDSLPTALPPPSASTSSSAAVSPPTTPSDFPVAAVLHPFGVGGDNNANGDQLVFSDPVAADLFSLVRWPEQRLVLSMLLLGCNTSGLSQSQQLNEQSLGRRMAIRRLVDLAITLRRMDVSLRDIGCLRLLILMNPDVRHLSETGSRMIETSRDSTFACLEHVCRQLSTRCTPRARLMQLCFCLADLSVIAERLRAPPCPDYQCLLDLIGCFCHDGTVSVAKLLG